MINVEALYKISYGLYIVSSGDSKRGNGFISNTVFQVSSRPEKFAACCNKNNHTAEVIKKSGVFAVSVLHKDALPEIFGRFGFKSGKDLDKMEGMQVRFGETGVPIVLNDAVAFLELKLIQTVDVGTHWMFIGELVQSEVIDDDKELLTYNYYRQVRKGVAPKNAPTYIDRSKFEEKVPTQEYKKFECPACGYVYDEAKEKVRFADLPGDWECPACGSPKSDFIEMN
jgi:flavin reductase (DIM6/NTAB) family NADH-FMN oxidoreductase RutF/rubredoxin